MLPLAVSIVATWVSPGGAAAGWEVGQPVGIGRTEAAVFGEAPALPPPPNWIAPPARAAPRAKTATPITISQPVEIPLDAPPAFVGPALARCVAVRVAPPWRARCFFDERGRGRFELELKRRPPGRR